MFFGGRVYKSGKHWIAESKALDAMTQGKSKADAIEMLKDWVRSLINDSDFVVEISTSPGGHLTIETEDSAKTIALVLQREREQKGLTVRDVARLLGMKSHNAYSQYERGKSEPSLSQFKRFMSVICPEKKVRLKIG